MKQSDKTPRWITSVVFLKDDRYPLPPIVHTIAASGPHVAAARAIADGRRAVMRGKRVNQVTVTIKRAPTIETC